jgi:glucokinase
MHTSILCGDIGGTKTRLAIASVNGAQVEIQREASYASADYPKFEDLLADFLVQGDTPRYAALGIAGPIQGRVVQTTNLPWWIDADALQARFGFISCGLLNDLAATACGLPALGEADVCVLQAGDGRGNLAVIAAGTGLGEAGLFWDGQQHRPFATEGGHTSFSPSNEVDMALLYHLQTQFEHVSWERVVSGMGIVSLYDFLRGYRLVDEPNWLRTEMAQGDAAAVISQAGMAGTDAICVETMQMFVRLYGAEAGNLALKTMSSGGLYIGGGIAPKILPLLQSGLFMQAFLQKGRMRPLLEKMPVNIILNERTALLGAALSVVLPIS